METKQGRRNRHIVQAQALNLSPAPRNDETQTDLKQAQLLLHNFLSQAEIAELHRQMIEAGSARMRVTVLNSWYDIVAARQKEPTIYELTQQAVEQHCKAWNGDVNVIKVGEKRFNAYISAYQQELFLNATIDGDVTKTVRVKCGQLHYTKGWVFTLKKAQYDNWVKKVKALLK